MSTISLEQIHCQTKRLNDPKTQRFSGISACDSRIDARMRTFDRMWAPSNCGEHFPEFGSSRQKRVGTIWERRCVATHHLTLARLRHHCQTYCADHGPK